jgi:hypothetical protein
VYHIILKSTFSARNKINYLLNLPPHNPAFLHLIRKRRNPICTLIHLRNQLQDGCHLDIPAVLGDSEHFVCGLLDIKP